jgi:hypothetical protein
VNGMTSDLVDMIIDLSITASCNQECRLWLDFNNVEAYREMDKVDALHAFVGWNECKNMFMYASKQSCFTFELSKSEQFTLGREADLLVGFKSDHAICLRVMVKPISRPAVSRLCVLEPGVQCPAWGDGYLPLIEMPFHEVSVMLDDDCIYTEGAAMRVNVLPIYCLLDNPSRRYMAEHYWHPHKEFYDERSSLLPTFDLH